MFLTYIYTAMHLPCLRQRSAGGGGDKGLGPPATLIGGYMVGSDQPPVTNQQQRSVAA